MHMTYLLMVQEQQGLLILKITVSNAVGKRRLDFQLVLVPTASSGRIVIGSNEIGGPNPAKASIYTYGYSPSINVGEVVITGNFLINHVRIGANTSNVLIANN